MEYGGKILYKGEKYPIEKADDKTAFAGGIFYVKADSDCKPDIPSLVKLLRKFAARDLTRKTIETARIMGVVPVSIKITGAKTRWGSCSANRGINYSWRLIMADERSIDYVIVHELAHITQFNHSAGFWNIVKTYCPDYKSRRAFLKKMQAEIDSYNL
ncbi:MAG: M48 family metallopeptidase [Ruminococcus sp.]|jgi:predicted metal-dependent hydrolase|nr:M48 family metallopeptidase [Ruminococcus sp.]